MLRDFFDPERTQREYKKILAHVTGRLSYADLFQLLCNDSYAKSNLASYEFSKYKQISDNYRKLTKVKDLQYEDYQAFRDKVVAEIEDLFPFLLVDNKSGDHFSYREQVICRKIYDEGFRSSDAANRFKEMRELRVDPSFDYCHDSVAKTLADELASFAFEYGLRHLPKTAILSILPFVTGTMEAYYWLKRGTVDVVQQNRIKLYIYLIASNVAKKAEDAVLEHMIDYRQRALDTYYIELSKYDAPDPAAAIKKDIIENYTKKVNPAVDVWVAKNDIENEFLRIDQLIDGKHLRPRESIILELAYRV